MVSTQVIHAASSEILASALLFIASNSHISLTAFGLLGLKYFNFDSAYSLESLQTLSIWFKLAMLKDL